MSARLEVMRLRNPWSGRAVRPWLSIGPAKLGDRPVGFSVSVGSRCVVLFLKPKVTP